MKFRQDYVTNSSSASYIICFARIADMNKAKPIIDEYNINVLNYADVKWEMRWGELGADWAGACIWGADKILEAHPDDQYIIIEDSLDADERDWDDIEYYYDFPANEAIDKITAENGFTDIDIAEGEGRNG